MTDVERRADIISDDELDCILATLTMQRRRSAQRFAFCSRTRPAATEVISYRSQDSLDDGMPGG